MFQIVKNDNIHSPKTGPLISTALFFMLPLKNLYELFGKGEFFLYLCGEITHTVPIPRL